MAVNLDPVLACNLRCKMCYFTDEEYVKKIKGQFSVEELNRVAKVVFKRALKLQIGCGTEPTLYKHLEGVVKLGKEYKVPYISLTTNANLLDYEKIEKLLEAGLNEFTISLHGVRKGSYEYFMGKASYEKFHEVFDYFETLKKYYNFKVRINYTFNKDNFEELIDLFSHFNGESFDFLQIRPIQKLGNTEYNNFDLSSLKGNYNSILLSLKKMCKDNNVILMAPDSITKLRQKNTASYLYKYTYCYVSPQAFWKKDFIWKQETFNQYSKRVQWGKEIWNNIFVNKKQLETTPNKLNYEVDLS
ncbi:radical SAM protein [Seonamhaeicola maritimus]|uniref:radical SAM protein n=1 Tax=Seonamhaeicola maritimus TaxID=2591822 RepID=UPI00249464B8|nr:radical SAM protein [Seonamhaeicola maritimus]